MLLAIIPSENKDYKNICEISKQYIWISLTGAINYVYVYMHESKQIPQQVFIKSRNGWIKWPWFVFEDHPTYKMGPLFDSLQSVNIIPMSLWFMVLI